MKGAVRNAGVDAGVDAEKSKQSRTTETRN